MNKEITFPDFPLQIFNNDIPGLFLPLWLIVYLVSYLVYLLTMLCALILNWINQLRNREPIIKKGNRKLRQ